jgi:hypothetical protein
MFGLREYSTGLINFLQVSLFLQRNALMHTTEYEYCKNQYVESTAPHKKRIVGHLVKKSPPPLRNAYLWFLSCSEWIQLV